MAEFLPPVVLEIQAKATQAIAQMQAVNGELDKMEAKSLKAGGSINSMHAASKYAGTALLGLAGVFGVFAVSSIKQLDTVEKAQANLQTAIQDTGISFRTAQPYVDSAATKMRNLGFSTQDTYGALTTLTAASRNPKVALDTLGVAADLARFKQISLTQAGTLLARATIGQAKGLGDLGIAIGKTIPKGASLQQILKAVEDRAHGTATAFSKTLAGGLATAQANFQNLEVQVGIGLVPALNKVVKWINNTGLKSLGSFFGVIKDNKDLVAEFVAGLAIIWAAPKATALYESIATLIASYRALAAAAGAAALAEGAAGTAAIPAGFSLTNFGLKAGLGTVGALYAGLQYAGRHGPANMTYQGQSSRVPSNWFASSDIPALARIGGSKMSSSSINSGLKPADYTSSAKSKSVKTSIKKQMKGTTGLGAGVNVNVYVDGAKSAAKIATQGAPLKSGSK
jgi:hypothetical protein